MPTRTTPTWEMELLVSGATVFGMIPVAALSPGRHELTVMPVLRDAPEEGDDPVLPYRIPFWR